MQEWDNVYNWVDYLSSGFFGLLFFGSIMVMISYVILAITSINEASNYLKFNKSSDFQSMLRIAEVPKISIIAPAFNEQLHILSNIRSLLSLHYPDFEVIVVNDGSKDDTLQKCIDGFSLTKLEGTSPEIIKTKPVRGVYRSSERERNNLIVVDKENGGKADALNAGINASNGQYILNIDVDSVLDKKSLLKMIKPILRAREERVIASGGVIRVANDCTVVSGQVKNVALPKSLVARFQVLEYLRAFLLGRVAWQRFDGLMLISGALGIFDREIVIACDGYDTSTVGEDLELVIRMRTYCRENKIPYKVTFLPEPLCYTEVPEDLNVLLRQRNRWTRGSIESVLKHKKLFFNPKYGKMGTIGYPYWVFFEWFMPLVEFFGYFMLLILTVLGLVSWPFTVMLFASIYFFAVAFTFTTLYIEEATYYQYPDKQDIRKLLYIGMLEPIIYHPLMLWGAVKGNWDFFFMGKTAWGVQKRKGFEAKS